MKQLHLLMLFIKAVFVYPKLKDLVRKLFFFKYINPNLFVSALLTSLLLSIGVLFRPTHLVLAIPGSAPIGCHGIPVSPEDLNLGTLHRTIMKQNAGRIKSEKLQLHNHRNHAHFDPNRV